MNCILRNYKFRLYPTNDQEQKLESAIDACRWVYNYFVKYARNNFLSRNDICYALVELKEENSWLNAYHSKMLQMVSVRLAGAEKTLITLRRKRLKAGKLHFARCDNYNSFTYNQSGFKITRHGDTDLLWLSKIGYIEIRKHREINNIKQITVIRKNGRKWYALITCDVFCNIPRVIDFSKSVGIDVGIKNFVYDSDNNSIKNPKNLSKLATKLARVQRKICRRTKGSNSRKKAVKWYQIVHERIQNRRNDFLHKLSRHYANKYDVIFVEKLQINNMVKNHHFARNIMDASWGKFKKMLDYKASMLVEVPSKNTTLKCSRCRNNVPKSLTTRIHRCDKCNLVIDRDYNASINILQSGLQLFGIVLPREPWKVTPVEISERSMKQEEVLSQRVRTVHYLRKKINRV